MRGHWFGYLKFLIIASFSYCKTKNRVLSFTITIAMSTELMNQLRNVSDDSFIGFCIQQILQREEELQQLLSELKTLSKENPEIMIPIIGKEAHSILLR